MSKPSAARSRNRQRAGLALDDRSVWAVTTPSVVREDNGAPSAAEPKRSALQRLRGFWLGEADLAPLGLFRIVYGILLFNWVWQLLPNLSPFFTDEGMLPRSSLLTFFPVRFSLLNVVGEWWQVWLFWLASLAVAVMLTVGYRTRTACVLAFLIIVSFQWRNPLILDGSDLVFRLVAFWMIFTAAGDRYSVDAALRRVRGDAPSGFGPALPVRILELQIAWIYLTTCIDKLAGTKWLDGTATYYALQLKHTFGRAWIEPLARNPFFNRLVTWGTLVVELAFLPLVFSPALTRHARLVAVITIAMLHIGIILMMNVGNFPVIMLAALILFLPPDLVSRMVDAGRRLLPRSRVRFYYDGACHFCQRTAAFLAALDIYKTITFVDIRTIGPSEASFGRIRLAKRIHVVDEQGQITSGFAAVARAGRAIPLLAPLAVLVRVPGLAWIADRVTGWLARRWLLVLSCPGGDCERHSPVAPPVKHPPIARLRWQRPAIHALVAVVALAAFASAVPQALAAYRTPEPFNRFLVLGSLDQRWNMFAPDPMIADGWLLGPGRLADGTAIDVITEGPASEEPRFADPLYSRWAKVTERIANPAYIQYRLE